MAVSVSVSASDSTQLTAVEISTRLLSIAALLFMIGVSGSAGE
jgi:hypothetical protein